MRIFNLKKIIALLLLIQCYFVEAQDYVDIAKVYYQGSHAVNFDSVPGTTGIFEYGAEIFIPLVLNENTDALLFGVGYDALRIGLSDMSPLLSLHSISLKAGISLNHSSRLNSTIILLPKIASNFSENIFSDFQMGGMYISKFGKKENFKYKLGIYYNYESFGHFLSPIIGCYFLSKSKKTEIDLSLPVAAEINYALNKSIHCGVSFLSITKTFNNNQSHFGQAKNYITKSTNDLYAHLRIYFTPQILFYAQFGYSIGRNFKLYESGDKIGVALMLFKIDDDRTLLNDGYQDGFIYRLSLRYRFFKIIFPKFGNISTPIV
ncbi:MAG: hypothetical protein IPO21_21420 [Bacteroidales bacterium]|nr:hypothetical protein [Bacteroidales bacterium]